ARYTERATARPAYWSDEEVLRFLDILETHGHPIYLLDDGQEMEGFMQRAQPYLQLHFLEDYSLPTFGLGGQEYGRPAMLYALEYHAPRTPESLAPR
ncbi:MAG: hypothetical protein H5T69_18640, partial [Chloroflexi bacterium]|nr:hypothetical protein [Chloroflexota bacterium]